MSTPASNFTVRNVQLLRALFAAAAALMITFSPDHSAQMGLSVFSGFVGTTALIFALAAWLVARTGERWPYIVMGLVSLIAAMVSGIPPWRTDVMFFIVVMAWAASMGTVEFVVGMRTRGTSPVARDGILIGGLSLLLTLILALVPVGFSWDYTIEDAGDFTLTGIILGVGIFGAYAALVAVFLGIAGLTPKSAVPAAAPSTSEGAS